MDTPAPLACPVVATRPDGGCCPLGHFFDDDTGSCRAVGPPECAAVVLEQPEKCVPRWCVTWEDAAARACTAGGQGCLPSGRACTPAELGDGAGCPAGRMPDAAAACRFPGTIADGQAASGPGLASPGTPVGVPGPGPLPPLDKTAFCEDSSGAVVLCGARENPCGAGRMPAAGGDGCIAVGVPWICPPGFVVDLSAPTTATALPGCAPDPADCPATLFGGVPPGPGVVYVDDDAPAGGDGTRAAPVRTIPEAVALSKAGGTVAVAPGVYSGQIDFFKPLTIHGACAAHAVLDAGLHSFGLRVPSLPAATKVVVRGLTVRAGRVGIGVFNGASLRGERLYVVGARIAGTATTGKGSSLDLAQAVIDSVQGVQNSSGSGLVVAKGAKGRLTDVRVRRCREAALAAENSGTELVARRVLVDATRPNALGMYGMGALFQFGAKGRFTSTRMTRNHLAGIAIVGSDVQARGLLIDHSRGQPAGGLRGVAALVQYGGALRLQGARLSGNRTAGIAAVHAGTTVDGHGLLIDATLPQSVDATAGIGASAQLGAVVRLDSGRLWRNHSFGLYAAGQGSVIEAKRLLIDDTLPAAGGGPGIGAQAALGARLSLDASCLNGNRGVGVTAANAGTRLELHDVLVQGTRARESDGQQGYGVFVQGGATGMLDAVRVHANRTAGLIVGSPGSAVLARGIVIDATGPRQADSWWGVGALAEQGASLRILGSRVIGNRLAGLVVSANGGTLLAATGVLVADTRPEGGSLQLGAGVLLVGEGHGADLRALLLRHNHSAALAVSQASATVRGCVALATDAASYPRFDARGRATDRELLLSDGFVAHDSPGLVVEDSIAHGQLRAGVLLSASPGSLVRGTSASAGHMGLAIQGGAPTTLEGNLWDGNDQAVVTDKGLYVPAAPSVSGF